MGVEFNSADINKTVSQQAGNYFDTSKKEKIKNKKMIILIAALVFVLGVGGVTAIVLMNVNRVQEVAENGDDVTQDDVSLQDSIENLSDEEKKERADKYIEKAGNLIDARKDDSRDSEILEYAVKADEILQTHESAGIVYNYAIDCQDVELQEKYEKILKEREPPVNTEGRG